MLNLLTLNSLRT